MHRSETISELAAALAEFNAAEFSVPKDKTARVQPKDPNKPAFTFPYDDLGGILPVIRPALAAAGLSIMQEVVQREPGVVGVGTWILHRSGEWIAFDPVFLDHGTGPQDLGTVITYLRRYTLKAALSIEGEDDGTPPQAQRRSGQATSGKRMASAAQVGKIRRLAEELGISELTTMQGPIATVAVERLEDLPVDAASALIDRLIAEKQRRAEAAAAGANPETGEVPA